MDTRIFPSRSRHARRQQHGKHNRFKLACETLEGRQLLATTLGALDIDITYGQTLGAVVNGGMTHAEATINGVGATGTWSFSAASNGADLTDVVLRGGSHTTDINATFLPDDIVTYTDTYTASEVDVEVAKARIAVVADSPADITYGTARPTSLTNTFYAELWRNPENGDESFVLLDSPTDLAPIAYASALGDDPAASINAFPGAILPAGEYEVGPTDIQFVADRLRVTTS
ncbi:hypothetical protein [Paludisphaera mucosa]|uniref:Uncharacterized protein n=1 Tax=Paludisphaera mucosa TaxID=3030827 RepID=A0ABT6FAN9_9BACT|nr:hypothetical protein [Paludisphaera mucosa]MDG3004453.1 hypothetical protein [Paludisphaera mucosa]